MHPVPFELKFIINFQKRWRFVRFLRLSAASAALHFHPHQPLSLAKSKNGTLHHEIRQRRGRINENKLKI